MRTTAELREGFQRFYEERGHLRVPSHSLIPPADDPSTLFIVAGMQQFKPYFLGLREPPGKRVVSVQKVLRAGGKDTDLEDVGRTDRHCSFFEMLGNFSFGDYFKDEAVEMAWEFVTKHMGLDPDLLWATVYEGNPVLGLGEDTVAIEAWKRVGLPPDRIVRLGKDNFWQAADTGPCGPCSEIFLDRGEEHSCGREDCRPGCECDRYMEFYNLVFMEFDLRPGPELVPLPSQNVDTGLGVERGTCLLQGVGSVFDTDGFRLVMDWVERESGVAYGDNPAATKAHRVLADHGRAMSFLIADGVTPSNEGRGYICRRIIRRAVQHGQRIGLEDVYRLGSVVVEQMGDVYPELREHAAEIERVVKLEEERFRETLARGQKEFDELAGKEAISGEEAFELATTYGFPIELTVELAEERGQAVDVDRFRQLMEEHREISRAGGESTTEQLAAEIVGAGTRASEFVGYDRTDVLTAVIAVGPAAGTRQLVKLEQSPFYAAGGGQVSDSGYLLVDGRRDVHEARRGRGAEVRRRSGARGRDGGRGGARGGDARPRGRRVGGALPDDGQPHGDAPAARRPARRARRPRQAGRVGGAAGQAPLRLQPPAAAHGRGARAGRAAREREGVRGDPGADVRDADRGGAQARRDDALRREVRRRGARGRDRRLLARALRRHARALDRRDRSRS